MSSIDIEIRGALLMLSMGVYLGPVAMIIIITSARRNLRDMVMAIWGAAAGDGLTALIVALSLLEFPQFNSHYAAQFRLLFGVILLIIGILWILGRTKQNVANKTLTEGAYPLLLMTFFSTLMNPVMIGAHVGLLVGEQNFSSLDTLRYGGAVFFASAALQSVYGLAGWLFGADLVKWIGPSRAEMLGISVLLLWATIFLVFGCIDVWHSIRAT